MAYGETWDVEKIVSQCRLSEFCLNQFWQKTGANQHPDEPFSSNTFKTIT